MSEAIGLSDVVKPVRHLQSKQPKSRGVGFKPYFLYLMLE